MRRLARRLLKRLHRPASLLLLPLSLLPLGGAIPLVLNAHRIYVRYYTSGPLSAPGDALSASERAQFTTLPAFAGQIPVLVYHGIDSAHDGNAITQRAFAAQMATLRAAGFRTISMGQYADFQHGDDAGLPPRPILVTFDDGQLDSFRGADRVLASEGFQATMFVVTGDIASRNPVYLDWTELHRMQRSGRWDIQPESYQGDREFAVDSRGDQAPFYAMRRYLRSTGEETFAAFERRVGSDLFTLADQFTAQGLPIHAIAVPFGDYGQLDPGNDPRVVPFVLGLLRTQFGTVFVQAPNNDPAFDSATDGGPQERWAASPATTPEQLYAWLRAHDPGVPTDADSQPQHRTPPTVTTAARRSPHRGADVRHHH